MEELRFYFIAIDINMLDAKKRYLCWSTHVKGFERRFLVITGRKWRTRQLLVTALREQFPSKIDSLTYKSRIIKDYFDDFQYISNHSTETGNEFLAVLPVLMTSNTFKVMK